MWKTEISYIHFPTTILLFTTMNVIKDDFLLECYSSNSKMLILSVQ
jgi:hypothetical protein